MTKVAAIAAAPQTTDFTVAFKAFMVVSSVP